jgi:hypothetical protein
MNDEEIFTLEDIHPVGNDEPLYCLTVDSPGHQFLIGRIGVPTHNTDEAKAANALKGEAQSLVGSIARLGRAAGVHLIIATQRPDAKMLPGELKANLGMRAACGHLDATASGMVLGTGSAIKTPGHPKGRGIISIYGNEEKAQIYYADTDWIDDWLAARGLNPDGTPVETGPSGFLPDLDANEKLKGSHLDEIEGVDNSEYIERLREEDAEQRAEHERKLQEYNEAHAHDDDDIQPTTTDGMARPKLNGSVDRKENPLDEWDSVMSNLDEVTHDNNDDTNDDEDDPDAIDLGDGFDEDE